MGRRIAAAAADDACAAIDGEAGVSLHQFRRAGIVDLRAVPLRHAGVRLGDQHGFWIGLAHGEDGDEEVGGADAAIGAVRQRLRRKALGEGGEGGRRDAHHRPPRRVEARRDGIGHADFCRAPRRGAHLFRRRHRLDPDDVCAAVAEALDLLGEDVDRLVFREGPKRREDVAGRPDRPCDDDRPGRGVGDRAGVLGRAPVEFAHALLGPVQGEAARDCRRNCW